MPNTEKPPAFEVHAWRSSETSELLAKGRAYTDGACRGFLRRTKRAGKGACVTNGDGHLIWGIYGTCPDAYASPLRAELCGGSWAS